jgi:plasmid stability protein
MRAASNGTSMEAEVREILRTAVRSERSVLMGNALAELGARLGLTNDDFTVLEQARSRISAQPMTFE